MDLPGSGITRATSTSIVVPSPRQSGQAPIGLLNENICGLNSSKERPQYTQAFFSEKRRSPAQVASPFSPPPDSAAGAGALVSGPDTSVGEVYGARTSVPSPKRRAVSTE